MWEIIKYNIAHTSIATCSCIYINVGVYTSLNIRGCLCIVIFAVSDPPQNGRNYEEPGNFMWSQGAGGKVHPRVNWPRNWEGNFKHLPPAECFHSKSQDFEGSQIWSWQVDGGMQFALSYMNFVIITHGSICYINWILMLASWVTLLVLCVGSWWLFRRCWCEDGEASWGNNGRGGNWSCWSLRDYLYVIKLNQLH